MTQPAFAEVLCFELNKCSFQFLFNHNILKSPPHQSQLGFQKDEQEIQAELTSFTSLLYTFLVLKTNNFYWNFILFFPIPYYLRYFKSLNTNNLKDSHCHHICNQFTSKMQVR